MHSLHDNDNRRLGVALAWCAAYAAGLDVGLPTDEAARRAIASATGGAFSVSATHSPATEKNSLA